MASVNAHKLLFKAPQGQDLFTTTRLPTDVENGLTSVRDLVRETLKIGFREWDQRVRRDVLFEGPILKSQDTPVLQPKFRMQGSFVYRTANEPAHMPPQEIDLDDGLFLPVAFFEKNNVVNPMVASRGLFALVEGILSPLCEKHGWELNTEKDSCVRIQVTPNQHMDIALYALSDKAFAEMVEKQIENSPNKDIRDTLSEGLVFDERIYEMFDESDIRHAHRQKGWQESDPRLLENWFRNAVRVHGEPLRRVCRYLKAWRDYTWRNCDECKVSSITLMQCAVMAYEELDGKIDASRDDIALREVTARSPEYFLGNILNPVKENLVLNDNWGEGRHEYLEQARLFKVRVEKALSEDTPKSETIRLLRIVFGDRLPNDTNLIVHEAAYGSVRAYEAKKVPQPNVKRSVSG